jgi:hypothetical protein
LSLLCSLFTLTTFHPPSRFSLQLARSPSEVGLRPFFGIYGPYNPARDPWSIPSNRAFLREFYSKALAWLADPGNKTYKVASVFIWSMASWDVLGVSYQD